MTFAWYDETFYRQWRIALQKTTTTVVKVHHYPPTTFSFFSVVVVVVVLVVVMVVVVSRFGWFRMLMLLFSPAPWFRVVVVRSWWLWGQSALLVRVRGPA